MFKSLRFFFLILPVSLQAQFTYVLDQTIPVKDEQGATLALPWAGGLNAAHYNTMDLNGDNIDDLVLFDRMADKILTFINQDDKKYQYAPEFEEFFPDEITNWLLLRDYNCDGKKDIFTGDIFGIKVYTNISEPGALLQWKPFTFYSGFPGEPKRPPLLTKGFSGKINLQLQFDDLPSITDADGDGDLDIFNIHFVGQGTVEFHKNFSKERYGTCDSLDFERITQKWGDFAECGCDEFAFNNEDCGPIGGRTQHAGGKSLLMLDLDNNSSLDVLFSEADCTQLYALKNEGTTTAPLINSSTTFPDVSPVNFLIFPAAFYEDVDFDGVKDLISVPNIFSKQLLNTNLRQSNWMYKNIGSNAAPEFSFSTSSFLQNEMIDVGDNAVPAFFDYDGDDDYDLFISQNNSDNFIATVKLYENSGTTTSPEFTLTNNDILGFSNSSFYNLKIQFADINSDSKTDLVFTATDFQNGSTRLYYFANQSNTGIDFSEAPIQLADPTLLASENVLVVDVDSDGFSDLLIGKNTGALEYWRNSGQVGTVSFSLENETYLTLGASILRQNISGTVADLDADGKADLVLGDQTGQLRIISNFREATDTTGKFKDIIFNPLAVEYQAKNLGGRIWPVAANIFGTNKPAIIVGNVLGGIYILRHDEGASLPKNPVISVYPNPIKPQDQVKIQIDRPSVLQIFTSLGQEIMPPTNIPANELYTLTIPHWAAGVYILRFKVRGKSFARRIVIY